MALQHVIIEVRSSVIGYLSIVEITNDVTGKIYVWRFRTAVNPTGIALDNLIAAAKVRIEDKVAKKQNLMNLTNDQYKVLGFLRDIKKDIILRIRAFPAVNISQARDYINNKYPNSIINFDNLYAYYLTLLPAVNNWEEFKTYLQTHKFEGID